MDRDRCLQQKSTVCEWYDEWVNGVYNPNPRCERADECKDDDDGAHRELQQTLIDTCNPSATHCHEPLEKLTCAQFAEEQRCNEVIQFYCRKSCMTCKADIPTPPYATNLRSSEQLKKQNRALLKALKDLTTN